MVTRDMRKSKFNLTAIILSHLFNGLVLVALIIYGAWFTSDGHYPGFHYYVNYYVDLSQAFLKGQAALLQQPSPKLANLTDTHLAPGSGAPFLWDASYYHGKYYIYWGPVPAFFYMIYTVATGQPAPAPLGVLAAYSGIAGLLLAFLYTLQRRFFPRAPVASIGLFLLAACVSPPFSLLLARPLTYETAIITGQMLLLAGLLCWAAYLVYHKGWLLAPAGLFWGLAVLSRYDLVLSAFVYTGAAALYLWITRPAGQGLLPGPVLKKAGFLLVPLAACLLGMAWYNAIRFGSPLQTGLEYQLTTPVKQYYSGQFAASNLYVYLIYPAQPRDRFPFVTINHFNTNDLPDWAGAAPGKQFDFGFLGLFHSGLIFWCAVAALLALILTAAWKRSRFFDPDRLPVYLLILMLLLAALLQFGFLLFYYYSAVRFLNDFTLPLLAAGFLALWELDRRLAGKPRLRLVYWLALAAAVVQTVTLGFFSGFALFPFYFVRHNPAAVQVMQAKVSAVQHAIAALLQPGGGKISAGVQSAKPGVIERAVR